MNLHSDVIDILGLDYVTVDVQASKVASTFCIQESASLSDTFSDIPGFRLNVRGAAAGFYRFNIDARRHKRFIRVAGSRFVAHNAFRLRAKLAADERAAPGGRQ